MSDNARRVGALIRDLRTAQGLSQGALAERVNNVAPPEAGAMLQPRVSAYEKGVWMPSPDTLRLFASALNVPYAQLAAAAGYADAARQRRAGVIRERLRAREAGYPPHLAAEDRQEVRGVAARARAFAGERARFLLEFHPSPLAGPRRVSVPR